MPGGINNPTITPDYFYGLAPGQTSGMINFPNPNNSNMAAMFGMQAHQTGAGLGVDLITPDGVNEEGAGDNGSQDIKGIKFSRSQTPYYLYFGLVPGKTALHKTVGKFFADKINSVTLEGVGESDNSVSETVNNQNNINNNVTNPYSIYRTCLGQTIIPSDGIGGGGITTTPATIATTTPTNNQWGSNWFNSNLNGITTNQGSGSYCTPTTNGGKCIMLNTEFVAQYPATNQLNMDVIITNSNGGSLKIKIKNDTADLSGGKCKATLGYIYIKDNNNNVVWDSYSNSPLVIFPNIPMLTQTFNIHPAFITTNLPINNYSDYPNEKEWNVPLSFGMYTVHVDKSSTKNGFNHPALSSSCSYWGNNTGFIEITLTT